MARIKRFLLALFLVGAALLVWLAVTYLRQPGAAYSFSFPMLRVDIIKLARDGETLHVHYRFVRTDPNLGLAWHLLYSAELSFFNQRNELLGEKSFSSFFSSEILDGGDEQTGTLAAEIPHGAAYCSIWVLDSAYNTPPFSIP